MINLVSTIPYIFYSPYVHETSPGKSAIFPLHLSATFTPLIPSSYWALICYAALPIYTMPDVISVRQTRSLPPASFRFHLTDGHPCLGYVLGTTNPTRDFHPLDCAHAGRT